MGITIEAPEKSVIPDTQGPDGQVEFRPYPDADRFGPEAWRWLSRTGVVVPEPPPGVEARDAVRGSTVPASSGFRLSPEVFSAMYPSPKIRI